MSSTHAFPARKFVPILIASFVISSTIAARAAISVGPGGSGVIAFSAPADTNGWTSVTRLPNAGTAVGTGADLDNAVQTNTAPNIPATATSSPVNGALTVDNTGAQQNSSRWNSTSGWLYTRPTGNAYQLLMAQLQNDSGGCINAISISFDMTSYSAATEELPGWHVYYSLTGAAGSWQLIPSLSDVVVNGPLSASISLPGAWDPGTPLYLLWADDNGNGVTDAGYTIDNLSIGITPCIITCVAITNQSGSITVPERGSATFSIMATGSPQAIQWYRDGTPIPGANGSTYSIASVAYPADNGAQFRATVSNSLCNVSSTAVTLTVQPDLTAPRVVKVVGELAPDTITVSFSEPIDVNFDPAGFVLFETGTDPGATPYNVYGTVLTNQTNIVLNTDPRAPGVNYSVQVSDVHDASSGFNVINPNPTIVPIRPTLLLIGFDADNEWKYSTETNLFGTGWETVGYDDSGATWLSGPGGLGYESDGAGPAPGLNAVPIRTVTAYQTLSSAPQFFRRHFNFPAQTSGVTLSMRYLFEDGAVVYLNGQEAGRFNVNSGALSVTTRTPAGAADPTPISGPVILPSTNLTVGDNVIAVVVIQSGTASSDSEMALELAADVGELLNGPPVVRTDPQSQTVNEGGNVSFSVVAEGAIPLHYQWRRGTTDLPGDSPTFSINGVLATDAGNYTVVVSNAQGVVTSAAATLTVNADLAAPSIVSAIGDTNLSVVVVTLHDVGAGIDLASAQNPANYQVHLTAGGGNLPVSSAVATNIGGNTVVTLTTSAPRTAGQDYTLTLNVTDRASAHNAVSPNSAALAATVLISAFDTTWHYNQSGNDLGTAWKESGFDDSAWPSGRGVLGFETTSNTLVFLRSIAPPDGTNTILSLTNNNGGGISTGTNFINVTFYFRTIVNVPFDPSGASFLVRAYIDDGLILYVNGTEQLRYNMTNGPGYTNFANAALTEPSPAPQTTYLVTNLSGLVEGNNVIAVEVHQDSIGSSDIDWGLQLEALVTSFSGVTPAPRLNLSRNPGTGQITLSWTAGGTCVLQETTQLRTPAASTVWGPSSVANGVPFTPAGPMKFYRLNCP